MKMFVTSLYLKSINGTEFRVREHDTFVVVGEKDKTRYIISTMVHEILEISQDDIDRFSTPFEESQNAINEKIQRFENRYGKVHDLLIKYCNF